MFENVIISKYNKIIYLLCLDDDIKNYKKNILNEKYNLYKNNILSYNDYYKIYNNEYFKKLKIYVYIYKLNFYNIDL